MSLLISSTLVGCSLKAKSEGANLSLVVPNPHSFSQLAGPSSGLVGVAPTAWNSGDFKCYGVNVVGPGITDTSKNPKPTNELNALFVGSTSCAYRGVLSNAFTFGSAGEVTVDLQVPPGSGRVIQLVGITNAAYCTSNFFEGDNNASPGIYELGRATADLFGDVTISIPITYAATESRRVDCGSLSNPATVNAFTFTTPAATTLNASQVSAVSLSGTCPEIGQPVAITSPGLTTLNTTCSANYVWATVANLSSLTDGLVNLTATHTSATAGVTIPPVVRTYTKDTGIPTVAISSPTAATTVNSAGVAAFTVSGTCSENGQPVSLTPSGMSAMSTPCASGAWTKTMNITAVAEGAFTISAQQTDVAGNASTLATRSFVKATTAPTVAVTSPAAGAYINSTNVNAFTVSGTCSANGQPVTNTADLGATVTCSAGAWTSTSSASALAEGTVTISVVHTDAAGNTSAVVNRSFIKDTTAPTVSLTNFVSGQSTTGGSPTSIQWTAADANGLTIKLEFTSDGGSTYTVLASGLANSGTYVWNVPAIATSMLKIRVTATDVAGNITTSISSGYNTIIGPPAQLYFTGPSSAFIGVCSGPYQMMVKDMNGVMVPADANISVTVTHPSGLIYAAAGCTGSPGVPIPISTGQTQGTFYLLASATSASVAFTASSTPSLGMIPNSVMVDPAWSVTGLLPSGVYARRGPTTVDTGNGALVWGGQDDASSPVNTGFKFNASGNTVTQITTSGAPTSRVNHTAVWTGTKMIIWGGYSGGGPLATGAVYDPGTGTWAAMTNTGAPMARQSHNAVWTGTKMIVWGGKGVSTELDDGAAYDPVTDTWSNPTGLSTHASRPSARMNAVGVWLGTKFFVWGGSANFGTNYLDTGALYDPTGDTWTTVSMTGVPTARETASAVVMASGNEVIIWGGYSSGTSYVNTGGRFNVSTGTWTTVSSAGAPSARAFHAAVWTGTHMLVWGGTAGGPTNTGGLYNPATNLWATTSTISAPVARVQPAAYFYPSAMKLFIWGGSGVTSSSTEPLQSFQSPY